MLLPVSVLLLGTHHESGVHSNPGGCSVQREIHPRCGGGVGRVPAYPSHRWQVLHLDPDGVVSLCVLVRHLSEESKRISAD